MIETLTVSLDGPAFSFLLYENMKSKFSQEGFLIGELVEKEIKTITDNDQRQVHISRVIRINSCIPCPQPFYFYDGIGRVDTEKIQNFLGDLAPKLVAWYKYKPSSSFNFTFRERIIHKQLTALSSIPPEFFSCCLLISESSDNNSTHSFTQTFVRCNNHGYEQLPLHIVNLSDSNNTYRSSEPISETFKDILGGLKINHKKNQGINIITKIQNALQKHTDNIVENLAEAEKRLFQLENEVKNITEMKKAKEMSSASNKDSHLNDVVMMDTDSAEESPVNSPTKSSLRGRGRPNSASKSPRRSSQSPVKKSGCSEMVTRSKKKV